jgi:ribosome-associated heat shock protein Hsp15
VTDTPRETIRLDKWLWHARFFKSRTLAAGVVSAGKVRVDGQPVSKPGRTIGVGTVLTFPKEDAVRVVMILALGTRRGPAPEARELYEDRSPEPVHRPRNPRFEGKGRPTKKDRRAMESHLPPDGSSGLE